MITTLLEADTKEWEMSCQNSDKWISRRLAFPKFFKVWDKICNEYWSSLMFHTFCQNGKRCDIQMDGWFGPDSGGEDWWCSRCGRGGRHTYY